MISGCSGPVQASTSARLKDAGHRPAALVALTGYGQVEHHRRSTDVGFDHHLVKPVDFALLRRITDEIQRARDGAGYASP